MKNVINIYFGGNCAPKIVAIMLKFLDVINPMIIEYFVRSVYAKYEKNLVLNSNARTSSYNRRMSVLPGNRKINNH